MVDMDPGHQVYIVKICRLVKVGREVIGDKTYAWHSSLLREDWSALEDSISIVDE